MATLFKELPSMTTLLSVYASISTITMLVRTVLNEMIPSKLREWFSSKFGDFFSDYFSSDFTFVIEDRWQAVNNELFRAVEVYLPTKIGPATRRLLLGNGDSNKITSPPKPNVPVDAKVVDTFDGAHFEWILHEKEAKKYYYRTRQYFELTCKKQYRELVVDTYLPYICKQAEVILNQRDTLNIYTYENDDSRWESTVFKHPATFDTLAMDSEVKDSIKRDLDLFVQRKGFFQSVGRAWKRGYLLYGPPGTGKSTLVAAIANYLRFHIYDLQLQGVRNDAELRRILTATTNKSILLIEDIDCSSKSTKSRTKKSSHEIKDDDDSEDDDDRSDARLPSLDPGVTLSGLLNFIDGLWSSCGDERIIIFTTNYKEKIDAALLRPGRMDVHIYMGHCTPSAFKKLASTYLGVKEHALFKCAEDIIERIQVTPAEIAQQLMINDTPQVVMESLVEFLKFKENKAEMDGLKKDEEEVIKEEVVKCKKVKKSQAERWDEVKSIYLT